MARIRMVKPEFFDDPQVGELSPLARLFFIGLWTQADREGRLIDDPRRLKARLFPFDDVDINALADELHQKDMIRRYKTRRAVEKHGEHSNRHDEPCKNVSFIWIRKFIFHQRPHPKEPASVIPVPPSKATVRHGEQCKNPAEPSESGVLILDSGTRKLERKDQAAAAPRPSVPRSELPTENLRIITKLAHEAIDIEGISAELGLLADAVKSLCSTRAISYNSDVVRKAVDCALAQRRVKAS